MDKKDLHRIVDGKAADMDEQRFDSIISSEAVKQPPVNFTAQVMGAINRQSQSSVGFFQVWSIIIGVMVAILLWAMEGFASPQIKITTYLPQMESVDLTSMTMVFMSVNALLALFLIDRWFQHRKRMSH